MIHVGAIHPLVRNPTIGDITSQVSTNLLLTIRWFALLFWMPRLEYLEVGFGLDIYISGASISSQLQRTLFLRVRSPFSLIFTLALIRSIMK